ncbi:MAG: 3-hydroxyisobutyrate dehydrogenase protein [Betaproteobacteria bacterium]|nr:3-hydroxyisobutyrate dehydrogenase protein [Betaproteobacteria bacterium]
MSAVKSPKKGSGQAVGVVGLGIMGGAFARHLRAAQFDVAGFDVAAKARAALVKIGGVAVLSSSEVAANTRILITSLPSLPAFEAALFGKDGVAAGARRGTIVIEASTLPLDVKEDARKRFAKTGVILLDCPISGTGAQAAVKDIVIYASGDKRAFAKCKAVFAGFARNAYYCGDFGAGSKLKFIANLLVTIHNLSTAEAFVLAERAGLDTELMYRVIKDGAGTSRMFEVRGPMMVKQNYLPATMKIDVYQKDIAIIKAFAEKLQCPTPLFSLSKRYYDKAYAGGLDKHDTGAVHAVLRREAGVKRRRGS